MLSLQIRFLQMGRTVQFRSKRYSEDSLIIILKTQRNPLGFLFLHPPKMKVNGSNFK